MDQNIFYRVMLNDKVKIEPKYLSKTYRSFIVNKIKSSVEGVCTKHGYVKQGSVEIYKIAPGSIELIGLNGSVVFDVYYYAEVCNPLVGNVVKATVVNMNKFGILAESSGILEVIIAKNSVSINHESLALIENVQVGQSVMIEVIGKKFELGDQKISIVGRMVSTTNERVIKPVLQKKQPVIVAEDADEEPVEDDEDDVHSSSSEKDEKEDKDDNEDDNVDESVVEDDDDNELLYQDGGNEFFDSDDDTCAGNNEYEFYSDEDNEDALDESDDEDY